MHPSLTPPKSSPCTRPPPPGHGGDDQVRGTGARRIPLAVSCRAAVVAVVPTQPQMRGRRAIAHWLGTIGHPAMLQPRWDRVAACVCSALHGTDLPPPSSLQLQVVPRLRGAALPRPHGRARPPRALDAGPVPNRWVQQGGRWARIRHAAAQLLLASVGIIPPLHFLEPSRPPSRPCSPQVGDGRV